MALGKSLYSSGIGKYVDPLGLFAPKAKGPADPDTDALIAQIIADQQAADQKALDAYGTGPTLADYTGDYNFSEIDPNTLAQLGPSAMQGIQSNQALTDIEMAALQDLAAQGREGLSLQNKADLARIQQQGARANAGNQAAIQTSMAQRGLANSGLQLAAQQQAAQDLAEQRAAEDLQVAAMNQQAQRQALAQSGQLAGNMSARDFAQQAQIAQAQDIINRFNTQALQEAQMYNAQGKNQAALANTQARQNFANQQAATQNAFRTGKADIYSQMAGRATKPGELRYNASVDQYNRQAAQAAQAAADRKSKLGAITGIGGAVAGGYFSGPMDGPMGAAVGGSVGSQLGAAL